MCLAGFTDAIGEEVDEPLGFDRAGDADQRRLLVTPVLGFHGDEEGRGSDGAVGGKRGGPARGELQLRALTASRDAVGKGGEYREQQRVVILLELARWIDQRGGSGGRSAPSAAPIAIP